MADEPVRLNKLVAQKGFASRREADALIQQGQVRVDGEVVTNPAERYPPSSHIELSDRAHRQQQNRLTVLINKPVGYVSGHAEEGFTPAVALVQRDSAWNCSWPRALGEREHRQALAPAGRLDVDSEGLLVLTEDGRVARQIIGPEREIEKEYLVRYRGSISHAKLERMRHGLVLDGRELLPADVDELNEDQLRFVLREGRKRQIRRMMEIVDLEVLKLQRVRIGRIKLGNMPLGQWRLLKPGERF